jgi:hypothetical protein
MDLNKKLIDQLSDLSRNIKSLTSEVKENKNAISAENSNAPKEGIKENSNKKESVEEQNKKFLKSLEDIFKKGVGEITKSNIESKGILNDAVGEVKGKVPESPLAAASPLKDKVIEGVKSNVKIPKGLGELLGKIPKFESGGVMGKTGVALVGEKGPEVVKLDKGAEVISNTKTSELLKKEPIPAKTAGQVLSSEKGATPAQIARYKKYLYSEYEEHYDDYPETLEKDVKSWVDSMRYHNPVTIHSLLEGKGEEESTFTQEDVDNLSKPVNKTAEIKEIPEEISKRDKRKKEREEKRKSKDENKKAEDLLSPKPKVQDGEEKPKIEKEGPTLIEKGKGFLKEKGAFEKGKNLLFSKGKDLLTGKASLKNPASLFGDKSQLMGKGVGAATSLFSNKELRGKAMDKLKGFKKEKKEEEKASITTESPELKKVKTEPKKEEEKKPEEKKPEEKKEIAQTESKTATPEKESPKKEPTKTGTTEKGSSEMGSTDMADIKSLLGRMVSLLEGPLSIETMDSPFRPDSRRF